MSTRLLTDCHVATMREGGAARSWDWAEKASCGSRARPISAA